MMKRKTVTLILISGFFILGFVRFGQKIVTQQNQLNALNTQISRLNQIKQSNQKQTIKKVHTKTTVAYADTTISQFFKIVLTWSSGQEYQSRVKSIQSNKLANSAVLKNKYLFEEVGGMADYIDNNGMQSRVDKVVYYPKTTNDIETSGVAVITINAKRSSAVGDGETRQYYFDVTYQKTHHQLTNISYTGRLAVNQSTENTKTNPYE